MSELALIDFDPAKYLTRVNGSDYLEVKFRLLWLRFKHPDADVETQLIKHEQVGDDIWLAIFKAVVRLPGGGMATGYGSETSNDFREFLEKAETKAIGRALAALGFGTQFSGDHVHGGIVDSPVRRPNPTEPPPIVHADDPNAFSMATTRQITYLQAMATRAGYVDEQQLDGLAIDRFGVTHDVLGQHQATTLAHELRGRPPIKQDNQPTSR